MVISNKEDGLCFENYALKTTWKWFGKKVSGILADIKKNNNIKTQVIKNESKAAKSVLGRACSQIISDKPQIAYF